MKTAISVLSLLLLVGLVSLGYQPREWQMVGRIGTLWLQRGEIVNTIGSFGNNDNPPVYGACEDGVPKLEYSLQKKFSLGEEREDPMYRLYSRVGFWSVRPLHIWGYDNIEADDCKFVLGWGTAFVIALVKDKLIWATVEHNVNTRDYFNRTVATNWFIREGNNWIELLPIGCKKGKYCLLMSNNTIPLLPINLFDDDYITNRLEVLETTYLYGCTITSERIRFLVHYRLHFFCLGNQGYVASFYTIPYKIGGDVLVSNPATAGFSGSPVLVWRDRWELVGVVNSGVEGVFTAVQFIDEDIIRKVKEWLDGTKDIFDKR
jgi:hypothetical protein